MIITLLHGSWRQHLLPPRFFWQFPGAAAEPTSTLRSHHVVRELTRLAHWHGRALDVELPLMRLGAAARAGAASLVQRPSDGDIRAAARVR